MGLKGLVRLLVLTHSYTDISAWIGGYMGFAFGYLIILQVLFLYFAIAVVG